MLAGDDSISVTGDFVCGERYELIRDLTHNCYLVEDPVGDVVALVPLSGGRDVVTSQGRFRIAIQHHRGQWRVEASLPGFRAPLGAARPSSWPRTYRVRCSSGPRYRLRQALLGGAWKLRAGRRRVAIIRTNGGFDPVDPVQSQRRPRRKVGSLETRSASEAPAPQFGLILALALETVRAHGARRKVPSAGY